MKSELYHSGTYLGKDYSDGIKHWKYVKKERVNGKWRYYYADEEYENALKEYNRSKLALGEYEDAYRKSNSKATELESRYKLSKAFKNDKKIQNDAYYKAKAERSLSDKFQKKYSEARANGIRAANNYENVKIKTATRRTIAKGIAAVANFFSNAFGSKLTTKTTVKGSYFKNK